MIGSFKLLKKDEEEGGNNPFYCADKTAVLQEARVFNETPVNVKRSTHILTKVLYLINQGEVLAVKEATDVFFAMTKLFQSNDLILRRLVYLGIKELCQLAEDTIIVTSSLTKDMTGREDQYRAPAIRALCQITDATMIQAIDRYMKQAIVDKVHSVSSAALVSCRHIMVQSPDIVKRWVSEVQEALSSDNVMVQFHALGVLHQIRKSDKLAVTKMVSKLTSSNPRSPYGICLLIRIVAKLIEEDGASADPRLYDFLESMLRHKAEMVIYEAANAIITLKKSSNKDLASSMAISVLQLFLSSSKPTLRYAAVRTLGKVAMTQPAAVAACNLDLESLLQDVNRSISTLAITTLLKTGTEGSVDRLMKSLSSYLNDISDEFKIFVVEALRSLALKYPRKQGVLMSQLAEMLRSEGGLQYKEAIAGTIITIIEDNPDAKEKGLDHLCEFIEDCEHIRLAVRILHLLGREGPKTRQPSQYIRFIYNRVILENAAVRAAAVSVLAKFGARCPNLLSNILVLLKRSMLDTEDEVRDRATYYHAVLSSGNPQLISRYILNPPKFALGSLERALVLYLGGEKSQPFDAKSVPDAPVVQSQKLVENQVQVKRQKEAKPLQDRYAEELRAIPAFASLGPLFRSSTAVDLTESETEYVVKCIKHVFANHIILQFDCTNTLNDQLLENVEVSLDGDGWPVLKSIPLDVLQYGTPGSCYILLSIPEDILACTASFSAVLKFIIKDCNPATGEAETGEGYSDDYTLEDLEISVCDHVQKAVRNDFASSWDEMGPANELEDTFSLATMNTIEDAVAQVTQFLGMNPCDRSDRVPDGKSSHTLYLAGTFRGGCAVLVRVKLALSDGITMMLTVRSEDPVVSELIASAVG